MSEQRSQVKLGPAVSNRDAALRIGHKKFHRSPSNLRRDLELETQWPDRDEFMNWRAPRACAREIDHVQNQPAGLAVQVAINHAGSFNDEREFIFGQPSNEIAKELAVVRQIVTREAPVEVGRKKGDSAPPFHFVYHKAG